MASFRYYALPQAARIACGALGEHHRESVLRLNAVRGQCSPKGDVDPGDINECLSQAIGDVLRADLKFTPFLHARGML